MNPQVMIPGHRLSQDQTLAIARHNIIYKEFMLMHLYLISSLKLYRLAMKPIIQIPVHLIDNSDPNSWSRYRRRDRASQSAPT